MIDTLEAVTAYLSDIGKPLSVGAVSGLGILRGESTMVIQGEQIFYNKSILGLASQLAHLKYGDQLVYDGETFQVEHDPMPSAAFAFCRVPVIGPIAAPPPIYGPRVLTTATGERLVTATGNPITTAQGFINA